MPVTVQIEPNSVFEFLAARFARGVDPDLDHRELFAGGGIIVRVPEPGFVNPGMVILMYSIQKTGFVARYSNWTAFKSTGLRSLDACKAVWNGKVCGSMEFTHDGDSNRCAVCGMN